MTEPAALLEIVTAGTGRLVGAAGSLSEADVRAPSQLPGWSRGHLLTHLARNADALVNVLGWAQTGDEKRMYPSPDAREEGIEAGAARPVDELVADLVASSDRFAEVAAGLAPADWDRDVVVWRDLGRVRAVAILVARLQEVEYHHVDLGVGYTFAAADPAAVDVGLTFTADRFALQPDLTPVAVVPDDRDRTWTLGGGRADAGGPREVTGTAADLLTWATGRATPPDVRVTDGGSLPTLPAWG